MDINKYLKTGYDWMLGLFADLVKDNRKNTDKLGKAIKDGSDNVVDEISTTNQNLLKVVKAIQDKEVTEKVEITNPEAIGIGIVDKLNEVVDTLKSEIIKIDKNVVIKNDLSSLAALFKGSNDKKDVINALSAISAQIKAHETVDYTLILDDIATLIESIKIPTVELGKIEKLLKDIKEKTVEFPDQINFLKDYEEKGRIKIILSEKQLEKMGSTVALQGGIGNGNATREGQDLIVSAIKNIVVPSPVGGATEAKQDEIITAIGNVEIAPPVGGATEDRQVELREKFNEFADSLKREEKGELNTIDENLRMVLGTERLVTNGKINVNALPEYTVKSKNLPLVTNSVFMVDVTGFNSLAIQISGVWTGTVSFECSSTGFDMFALNGVAVNGTAVVSSATVNGIYRFNVAGLIKVQARFSTATTGSPICSFIMSPEPSSVIGNTVTVSGAVTVSGTATTTDSILPGTVTSQALPARVIPVAPTTPTSGISNFLTKFPQIFQRLRVESAGSERLPFAQEVNSNKMLVSDDDGRLLLQDILEQLKISNSLKMQEIDWNGMKNLKIPDGYKEL